MIKKIVIAVDGYSSCGKSTLAKSLASLLGYIFIDSGAMYRAVTLFCLRKDFIKNGVVDEASLLSELKNIKIDFRKNSSTGKADLFLNDENVECEIRGMIVSDNVSYVSKIAEVRRQMVLLQQEMGKDKGIVMDGRDIGTVVFPDAELKIFMTADPEVRAKRRYDEFVEKKQNVSFEDVLENLKKRDFIDENREESPLRKASDAVVIDNSNMSKAEQLNWITTYIKNNFSL